MTPARPFYLDLMRIKLPIGGFVSILHRVTGAVLCLAVPGVVYAWMRSLRSPEDFDAVTRLLGSGLGWLLGLGLLWALLHHFFAGLRHLGFDLGWGEDKATARATAWAVLAAGVGLAGLVVLGESDVRRVGGAHRGLDMWIVQRASALFMVLYLLLFAARVLTTGDLDYQTWRDLFAPLAMKVATLLFATALLAHAWIGLREIFIDYVHPMAIRLPLLFAFGVLYLGCLVWAADILWSIA